MMDKMKKVPINREILTRYEVCENIHFEIYGPLVPSLGGKIFADNYLEQRTSMSEVFLLKKKGEVTDKNTQLHRRNRDPII